MHIKSKSYSNTSPKKWWQVLSGIQNKSRVAENQPSGLFGSPLAHCDDLTGLSVPLTSNAEVQVIVPVLVHLCGDFLTTQGKQSKGVFRVSSSHKRINHLQKSFETPPSYGAYEKFTNFTVHDVANTFKRFILSLPEPVIPRQFYQPFRSIKVDCSTIDHKTNDKLRNLIKLLPQHHYHLLVYLLDFLGNFAQFSDQTLMTSYNLATAFQPGVFFHPNHSSSPSEYLICQRILDYMICNYNELIPHSQHEIPHLQFSVQIQRLLKPLPSLPLKTPFELQAMCTDPSTVPANLNDNAILAAQISKLKRSELNELSFSSRKPRPKPLILTKSNFKDHRSSVHSSIPSAELASSFLNPPTPHLLNEKVQTPCRSSVYLHKGSSPKYAFLDHDPSIGLNKRSSLLRRWKTLPKQLIDATQEHKI